MTPPAPSMPPGARPVPADPKRGRGRPPTHGLRPLKRTPGALGGRVIDRRTALGKQLAAWKAALIRDLGGDVITQQAAVIELAVRTKLLLDSIDAWLFVQGSLVNARKRALIPVVRERQALADALARYMTALGLDRKAREVPDLHTYLVQRAAATETRGEPAGESVTAASAPKETEPWAR